MTKIDSSLYLQNQNTASSNQNKLGQDAFLKILMTQLQNQDPLSPMEDTQFISQMATFTSLEQLMSISESIDKLVSYQSITPIVQYSHLIGKQVNYQVLDEEGIVTGTEKGIVKSVSSTVDGIQLELGNGEKVPVNSIVEVSEQEKVDV